MNDMYTVRTFREKLREAFNKAEAGEVVLIERYGKAYALIANKKIELDSPLNRGAVEPIGSIQDEIDKLIPDPIYTDIEEAA